MCTEHSISVLLIQAATGTAAKTSPALARTHMPAQAEYTNNSLLINQAKLAVSHPAVCHPASATATDGDPLPHPAFTSIYQDHGILGWATGSICLGTQSLL
jgi:hypothetical protein